MAMIFKNKFVLGMIHLEALPPYPESKGLKYLMEKALRDLDKLQEGGVDGVIVENEWDHPHTVKICPTQAKAMTEVVKEVVKKSQVPVGLSVLLNDWKAAFTIAKASEAKFVRLDVFVDHVFDPSWGYEIKENPKEIQEFRKKIEALDVLLMVDIQVKYKKMLEAKTKVQSALEAKMAGADMIVVTGEGKMRGPDVAELDQIKKAVGDVPVVLGNGVGIDNFGDYLPHAYGFIVGYAFKEIESGPEVGGEEISVDKVKKLMGVRNSIKLA